MSRTKHNRKETKNKQPKCKTTTYKVKTKTAEWEQHSANTYSKSKPVIAL